MWGPGTFVFRDSADRWHAEYQCLLGEKYIVEAEEAEARQKLEALVTESANVLTVSHSYYSS